MGIFVLERCVPPPAERDAHFVRDVCFASDVRFAREDAEHITSLCAKGAIHHYGEAITSLLAATSLRLTPRPFMLYCTQGGDVSGIDI